MTTEMTKPVASADPPEPVHHGAVDTTDGLPMRLVLPIVAATLTIVVAMTPVLHFAGWRAATLVLAGVLVLWFPRRTYRSAFDHVQRGVLGPDLLATVAVITTYAWAAFTARSADTDIHIAVTSAVTTLVIIVDHVQARAVLADNTPPRWLVFGVLTIAIVTFGSWWAFDGLPAAGSAAVAVLIVGCGAPLILATSSALLVGAKRGSSLGLRFGGTAVLDAIHTIDTIMLDKVRTITTGDLRVVSVVATDPEHDRNIRWFAAALEHSAHDPIGRAIAKLAGRGRLANVEQHDGLGISGAVDRHPVRVGRPSWIGLDAPAGVGTTVAVEIDSRALGHITVADAIRPHAAEAVAQLRKLALDPVLLSDDNAINTADLAAQVGIDTYFPDMDHGQRSELIIEWQQRGHTVAMVGDLDANADALDQADLAITAAGNSAAPTAITIDDINVSTVASAIRIARATRAKAITNRRFALTALLVPLPFAATGLINPVFAALIAILSTITVGANSLRLQAPIVEPVDDPDE